jgi:S-adenosylmethionine uptake transporter
VGVLIVLRPGRGDGFSIGHLAALGAAVTGALTSDHRAQDRAR